MKSDQTRRQAMDIASQFTEIATALISDNLERLPGAIGLRPFHNGRHMVGVALTVRTRPGDNLAIHQVLELVKPGDVIVVDGGGAVDRALVGEIMVAIAAKRGARGFVLDGAIRDAAALGIGDFPVFARAAIHRGPYKSGPGEINLPVSIGGQVIFPGDIVVGDADGVVGFAPAQAEALLVAARAQAAKEAEMMRSIAAGTYKGAYAR
ncbi:MAG: methyltransferase [Methylobacterium sp.]|nr:methyltransferase [Methylobacterium sp.]